MWRTSDDFIALVLRAHDATPVSGHLAAGRPAIVLVRYRAGGGATNWFYCQSGVALRALARELTLGCKVSFYFDDRIRRASDISEVRAAVEGCDPKNPNDGVTVGALAPDGLHIKHWDVIGLLDLADAEESFTELGVSPPLFYGRDVGPDNDGERAVTLVVPDEDGVVRRGPY